jgi:cytochrome oxidase assembly protein ShyY1
MRQPTEEEVRIAKSIRTFVLVTVGAMFALFLPPLILVYLGLWLYSRKAAKARLASANNATQSAFTGASVALPAANNALTSPSRRLSASRRKALAR